MKIKDSYFCYGSNYQLIHTQLPFALYKDSKTEHYELLKLRTYKKDFKFPSGVNVKQGDTQYPSTNEWGYFAWSFISFESAMKKLDKLTLPDACSLTYPNATAALK